MRRSSWINLLLLVVAVGVFAVALVVGAGKGDFGGTDAAATGEISAVAPDYQPWYEPVWVQPGGEIESGLFALQAAIGGGIVGFVLGAYRERRKQARGASSAGVSAADHPTRAGHDSTRP
ncbi:energy-coupling factor ABC transporter substrate-binding protein [Kribbia dieselivorans]|uniref:energy-coupling factor ABC transporter substrate-binding protein n=1 Tax=Kribbia dieselivorans TaxID=331526 RepID=UPI00083811E3|nr:energy-coupling factor ABC transporter substrate-binding protein [Kribbia dieselivorans]